MAKSLQKIQARQLRRTGKSIKEIAKMLEVSVASVSSWCRDIPLTEEQIKLLQKRVTDPYYGKKAAYLSSKKAELALKIESIHAEALQEIGMLNKRELFLVGIALYWGEGFKKDHQVGFATSDTKMAIFFIKWLEECFSISKKDLILRVTANISHKSNIKLLETYWTQKLGIPLNSFSKPFFQKLIVRDTPSIYPCIFLKKSMLLRTFIRITP